MGKLISSNTFLFGIALAVILLSIGILYSANDLYPSAESIRSSMATKYSCKDSDGGFIPDVYGYVYGYYKGKYYSYKDYCMGEGSIMEYYCSGSYYKIGNYSCGTDGYIGLDYCIGNSVYRNWRDYYCLNGKCGYSDGAVLIMDCYYGCANGYCVPAPPATTTTTTIPIACTDSDGGFTPSVKGYLTAQFNGTAQYYEDYCINSTALYEYYCSNYYYPSSYPFNCVGNFTQCLNGACIK